MMLPDAPPPEASTRIRLDIAYDGTDFAGWSSQPALRTVQGELEKALATIFNRHHPHPLLTVAGRTDAGVHATGQVAHLDLNPAQLASLERPLRGGLHGRAFGGPGALTRRLNGLAGMHLDLHVVRASLAPEGFDARFSANWRRYEYRVSDARGPRNPLQRSHTLWHPAILDLDAMNAAADALTGLHDWAAFCKPREFATTIRDLESFRWSREGDGVFVASVRADAFCHSMVRTLVGATVAVGSGKVSVAEAIAVRDDLDRALGFKVMPAKALTLVEVGYPADAELANRVEQTRRHRIPAARLRPNDDAGLTAPAAIG